MKPLAVAVIGCGHLGGIHARKVARNPQFALKYVVDPRDESRAQLANEAGATPLASYHEIDEIDAAIVAAPTSAHYQVAGTLLERGVHLLVEKPLTVTSAEANKLCQLANRRGCVLQVGHVERFNPAFVSAQNRLREPKYISARRTSGFTFRSVDIGAVLDLMIHDIDIALQITESPVVNVSAFGLAMLSKPEDLAQARLEFANGCVADLFASRISPEKTRCMRVIAPSYSAHLDFSEQKAKFTNAGAELRGRSFDAERYSAEERSTMGPDFYKTLFQAEEITCSACDAIEAEHANLLDAILGRQPSQVDGQAGWRAIEVAERILEAIEGHQWDGRRSGRMGPLFEQEPQIIRPTKWQPAAGAAQRRAG